MNEHPQLVAMCSLFLSTQGYESRKFDTETAMRRMYEYLKKYYEQPPPLGVQVEEKIETRDKMG